MGGDDVLPIPDVPSDIAVPKQAWRQRAIGECNQQQNEN